jgi:hypothetical protein
MGNPAGTRRLEARLVISCSADERQIQTLRLISFSNAVNVGLTTAAGSSILYTNIA